MWFRSLFRRVTKTSSILDRKGGILAKRPPLMLEQLEARDVPSATLVAAYNFDQGAGAVLTDVSGSGNNGAISNASWVSTGKYGGALSFSGNTNSFVSIASSASLNLTAGMTLEAWVDPKSLNSPDNGWAAAIAKEHVNSSNDIAYALYAANGTGTGPGGHVLVKGADYGAQGSSALPLNQWSFLSATYDGSTLRMYLNGSLVGSRAVGGSITSTSNALKIGGDWSGEMFTGLIDNVRVYNGALSQSAIQADMKTAVGGQTAPPPSASAGPNESGPEGSAITFSGAATGGSGALSYAWSFGDGGAASGSLTPSHVYQEAGTYQATLTVTDSLGRTSSSSDTVTVSDVTPTAGAGGPYSAVTGAAVSFAGSATDSPADVAAGLKYSWTFGDGGTSALQNPTHAYAAAGTYTASLTVTDADGLTASSSATVTVSNPSPPTASAGPSKSGSEGSSLSFSGSASGGSGGLSYAWSFGDGATASGTLTPSHTYAEAGNYTVTLTVTDSSGQKGTSTTTAAVAEVTPTANAGGPYGGVAGTAVAFTGTATDSPADVTAGLKYSWSFGDGGTSTLQNPTHAYAAAGTYTASLTVTDADGLAASSSATVTITQTSNQVFPNNTSPPPLPAPTGTVINVSTVTQLQNAVANLQSGQTILIAAGTYNLTGTLYVPQNLTNIAIRGATGKAGDVIIKGDAVLDPTAPYNGSAIWGSGSGISGAMPFGIWLGNVQGVTIADMTIENFVDDAIIMNAGVQSPLIHDVTMLDTGEQLLKSNPNGSGGGVNNGVVEYCTIGYSVAAPNNYTNGIDVHTGQNWIIRDNVFQNIYTTNPMTTTGPGALAGPAVLIWNGSSNATVTGNVFIDCQREIAFGLSDPSTITDDNTGGLIANNFIYRSGSQHGDVAIGVWNSPNTEVAYNTVVLNGDYANAVEYRFSTTTGVKILYNLTDAAITQRDGASATVAGNVTNAQASWFVNESAGNLSLTAQAAPAIGHGVYLSAVPTDYFGNARPTTSAPDVGADQYSGGSSSPAPAPTVTGVTPTNGATEVATGTSVTVTFSGAVDPTTVTGSTVELLGPSNAVVAAAVSFNASTDTATLTPTSALAQNTTYTVDVLGGGSGPVVKNTSGTPLAATFTSTFTTDPPAPPPPPVASAGPNESGPEGSAVAFSGSATGGSGALSYAWSFGDGGTASGSPTPTHAYEKAGTYTATLTVTDALGRTSSSSDTVTVSLVAPTVGNGGPYSGTTGAAIAFSGSASDPSTYDTQAGFTYSWSFGDGATASTASASHAYGAAGTYTVTLTVTDAEGASTTSTTTANVAAASTGGSGGGSTGGSGLFNSSPTVTTPYLSVPNFGAKPTDYSVKSGAWSDPTVWSAGRAPVAGDVVDINPGTTVAYDVNDAADSVPLNTVEVQNTGTLTFATNVNTQVCVANFLVLPGGSLVVGTAANPVAANVHANIDIANRPLNSSTDPNQFGDGLIVLGNVTMHGATKAPYVTLAQEAHAGDAVLHLASPATGWQAGDDPLLPDTRQLFEGTNTGAGYKPQWERATIQSISADGLTVTLSAPLKYDHLGARDANGVLDYLPQVMNDSRNVMVESQSMTGTRGYTLFSGYGGVDVEYAGFCELGRSTGSNVADRYAMTVLDLIGPSSPQADGYQYTFVGNEVDNDGDGNASDPQNLIWGLAVNNSFYGLIQGNDVFDVAGSGIGVEDGASSYNRFDGNLVAGVTGSGVRLDDQMQGDGFWFHNPNNYVTNNIATDINPGGGDVYSYGFSVDATTADMTAVGSVPIPTHQGADPSQAGQSATVNMNATPLLQFSGNEAYGATSRGFATWWLGTQFETPMGSAGTLKNSVVWNTYNAGYFTYETNGLVIDGFTVRGDASQLNNPYNYSTGLYFGDYMTRGAVVENLDIQDEATGIAVPTNVGRGGAGDMVTFTIQNAYLRNIVNIDVPILESANGGGGLSSRTVVIQDVQFAAPAAALPSGQQSWNVYMDTTETGDPSFYNTTSQTIVDVYNYNDVSGDNFQAYYSNNHPAGATQRSGVFGYVKAI